MRVSLVFEMRVELSQRPKQLIVRAQSISFVNLMTMKLEKLSENHARLFMVLEESWLSFRKREYRMKVEGALVRRSEF